MNKMKPSMSGPKAVQAHEKNMHPGKTPTKFKKGGPTTDDYKNLGRNMARAANQKTG
jgi:hypothetical protein